jgi:hypothetical protein
VRGSIPAALRDGPAIIPMPRGEGASIHSASSPALPGATVALPSSTRFAPSVMRSSNVAGSPPGFSTGMTSLLVSRQPHAPPRGLNSSAG